jgi:hypothetical protein
VPSGLQSASKHIGNEEFLLPQAGAQLPVLERSALNNSFFRSLFSRTAESVLTDSQFGRLTHYSNCYITNLVQKLASVRVVFIWLSTLRQVALTRQKLKANG